MNNMNLSPEQMRQGMKMMENMDPEMLKSMAKNMGMGHMADMMNQDTMKQAKEQMSQMDDSQLHQMQDTAKKFHQSGGESASTTSATPTTTTTNSTAAATTSTSNSKDSHYNTANNIKLQGNNLFKTGKYEDAANLYTQSIRIIEDRIKGDKTLVLEYADLEVSCRNNLANCLTKLNKHEEVIEQCEKVLKYGDNFKALYRLALALKSQGKMEEAHQKVAKALKLNPNDATVKQLNDEIKSALGVEVEPEKEEELVEEVEDKSQKQEEVIQENTSETPVTKKKLNANLEKRLSEKETKLSQEIPVDSSKSNSSTTATTAATTTTKDQGGPTIYEEKPQEEEVKKNEKDPEVVKTPYGSVNADTLKKSQEQMMNASDDQIKSAVDMTKNMSDDQLKSIMQMQGMNMDVQQFRSMMSMVTPDTVKMAGQMMKDNNGQMPNFPGNTSPVATTSGDSTVNTTSSDACAMPTPSMGDAMKMMGNMGNMDLSKMMTPEMMKSMGGMLGDNHPLKSMLNSDDPQQMQKALQAMQTMTSVVSRVAAVCNFFFGGNRKYITLGGVVLLISYYYS